MLSLEVDWFTIIVGVIFLGVFAYYRLKDSVKALIASPDTKPQTLTSPKASSSSRNLNKDNSFSIFFGSQSGTAQTFAYEMAEEAKTQNLSARVIDLEGYDNESLGEEKLVVFLLATFGEGEPTDNAIGFYEWINSAERSSDQLVGTHYAVFALGNRQYEHFCSVGRKVDERMAEMGAIRIIEHGEGDDDGSLEDDYNQWKEKFWMAVNKFYGRRTSTHDTLPRRLEPSFTISFIESPQDEKNEKEEKKDAERKEEKKSVDSEDEVVTSKKLESYFAGDPKHNPFRVSVTVNRELREFTGDDGRTSHLELELSESKDQHYITADNLGIYPRNEFKLAAKLARRLNVPFNSKFTLHHTDKSTHLPLPSPCTVSDALLWYCDFQALCRQNMVKTLAAYATEKKEQERLVYLGSNNGRDEFTNLGYSTYEIFEAFPSITMPFAHFIEFIPKLQPRFYTIASSNKAHPNSIHLAVSLNITDKPNGRRHFGLCSSYLVNARAGREYLWCFLRTSSFRLPKQISPIIMVGPGTGVAPFRAFIQEAYFLRNQIAKDQNQTEKQIEGKKEAKDQESKKIENAIGPMILFFGCRNSKKDYIYKDELKKAEKDGILQKLVVAFSREADKKVYVQDKLSEMEEEIWDLIYNKNASFYVCGGAAMGKSIRDFIKKISETYNKNPKADIIKQLTNEGRYIVELWS